MDRWHIMESFDFTHPRAFMAGTAQSPCMMQGDTDAHSWDVAMMLGGVPASLTGYSVRAMFVCPDGNTVYAAGTIRGNVASVVIPATVYAFEGKVSGSVRLYSGADGSEKYVTVAQKVFRVRASEEGGVIADRQTLPALSELMDEIEAFDERLDGLEGQTSEPTLESIGIYAQAAEPTAANARLWIKTSEVV